MYGYWHVLIEAEWLRIGPAAACGFGDAEGCGICGAMLGAARDRAGRWWIVRSPWPGPFDPLCRRVPGAGPTRWLYRSVDGAGRAPGAGYRDHWGRDASRWPDRMRDDRVTDGWHPAVAVAGLAQDSGVLRECPLLS